MPYYPEKKPDNPKETKQETKTTEKRRRILCLSIAVVSCLMIAYSGIQLIRYFSDLAASRQTGRELQQIRDQAESGTDFPMLAKEKTVSPPPVLSPTPVAAVQGLQDTESLSPVSKANDGVLRPVSYPDNPKLEMSERFRKLRKKGKYIIGWISVDQVDEAVVQKDNTFFLNHDALGKRNSNGAIFLDEDTHLITRPYTFFLYGHNMKSGNMFGRLKKYKENTYFYQHRIITFDTIYEEGQYAVFSVMEMNTVPGTGQWYDLWSLNTDSSSDREKAIRTLEGRSAIHSMLDVQADDQLLLLVTCLDGETERLVVAARRLRDGETADRLALRKE